MASQRDFFFLSDCPQHVFLKLYKPFLNLPICLISTLPPPPLPVQDVSGANAAAGQRGEVYVSLHRPFHVGGCGTEEQDHGGESLCRAPRPPASQHKPQPGILFSSSPFSLSCFLSFGLPFFILSFLMGVEFIGGTRYVSGWN